MFPRVGPSGRRLVPDVKAWTPNFVITTTIISSNPGSIVRQVGKNSATQALQTPCAKSQLFFKTIGVVNGCDSVVVMSHGASGPQNVTTQACQRYWTAGGTLRNIAPGSGRRKSKSKAACRENRTSPSIADHITAAAAAAQTGMLGLPTAAYGNLNTALLTATDPSGLLPNGATPGYAHSQLLAGHAGLAGLKLSSVAPLAAHWSGNMCLPAELNSSSALREHLQAHIGPSSVASSLAQMASGHTGIDARLLVSGSLYSSDTVALAAARANSHSRLAQPTQGHSTDGAPTSSPCGSPPPQPQQQVSSPQQPNSQLSQQPSPPQAQHNGAGSEDAEGDGGEVRGRQSWVKAESEGYLGKAGGRLGSGGLSASAAGASSSLSNAQLAQLHLPPSMASLAAVMGQGAGLGGGVHALSSQQDDAGVGLSDSSLNRHNLHLALQQNHAAQHESLQQLNGLLPSSAMTAAAALQAQQSLLHSLGAQGAAAGGGTSAAAAVAALDPLQRSAFLQQAAGLGTAAWLHGHNSVSGMLPSAAMAAAALESLQVQSLGNCSVSTLLQAQQQASAVASTGTAADWLSAVAAGGPKGTGPASAAHHSAATAIAAAHAAGFGHGTGAISGAAQVLQAQVAAVSAGGSCGAGGAGWPVVGSFAAMQAGAPAWQLWSAYGSSAPSNYAGYALQAAAAAAYSGGR